MKPQRMCTVCRELKSREKLFRVVKTPDGVFVDVNNKIQGRGAYICKGECVLVARKRTALERSLSCKVDSGVYDILEDLVKNAE
ncbi:MAG: YlxR family protein [Clostridia bacterium]|nr:YlxR family protein [Clostridia bacterium]